MRCAQSSIEAALIITFMILVMITFVGIMAKRMIEVQYNQQLDSLEKVAGLIENEIHLASSVQPGYQREFSIPVKINGLGYNVTIINSSVLKANSSELILQSFGNKEFTAVKLITGNITGKICAGINKTNIIIKEENWIRVRCRI